MTTPSFSTMSVTGIRSPNPASQASGSCGRLVSQWATAGSLRKAYVDKINVTMTDLDPEVTLKQLQTDSASADLAMTGVTSSDVPGLINDPSLNLQTEVASNPYIVFNTQSPNNNGALGKVEVRQALSYALNRQHLIQVAAGPKISPPLTHVLPADIEGSEDFDQYPHDATKAKQLLTDTRRRSLPRRS